MAVSGSGEQQDYIPKCSRYAFPIEHLSEPVQSLAEVMRSLGYEKELSERHQLRAIRGHQATVGECMQEDCLAQSGSVRGILYSAVPAQERLLVAHVLPEEFPKWCPEHSYWAIWSEPRDEAACWSRH